MDRPKLQTVDPAQDLKRAEQRASAISGKKFRLFKEGHDAFVFSEGKFFFRFLPQPLGAENSWYLTLPVIYLNPAETPQFSGYFALSLEQEKLIQDIRQLLYRDPTHGPKMVRKTNPTGVALQVKYRSVFMGFVYNDSEKKVLPIVLPSNGHYNPQNVTGIQAGTQVTRFMFDTDFSGKPKYGNIVDPETGSLICVEVKGQKDRREYTPTVDAKTPVTDPSFDNLISQVVPFESIVSYNDYPTFLEVIKARLPEDMFQFVAPRILPRVAQLDATAAAQLKKDIEEGAFVKSVAPAPMVDLEDEVVPAGPASAPTASAVEVPLYKKHGFSSMEEFAKKLTEDPSFLTRGKA